MKKIVLASNNRHKVQEIKQMLVNVEILTLGEIGFTKEIPETADTFEGNASLKCTAVFNRVQIPTLADDSGLEVHALSGAPGVFSKRYADSGKDQDNIEKLLNQLVSKQNRKAQFRTVLCYFDKQRQRFFQGVIKGKITREKRGNNGFGYDPIFMPEGYEKTFAEMDQKLKNTISHRALAVEKWIEYMKTQTLV